MRALGGALVVLAVLVAGCGNDVSAHVVGDTGVTVDAQGAVTVIASPCETAIDQIAISADREGLKDDEPNPVLATWTTKDPQDGVVVVPLDAPGWKPSKPITFESDKGYIVIADQAEADVEAAQVNFRGSDLKKLTGTQVIVGDRKIEDRSVIHDACD